jgi:thiosulfate/3-mercaptopyruvate sulfurtransferase
MPLVNSKYLSENIDRVKIIDCSWHMPNVNRDSKKEYDLNHIANSIFFDLDENSRRDTDLPHMLVNKKEWEKIVSSLGIKNSDEIVIYDNSDVISSCRCWYNFIYYGHDINLVNVLNGGLSKWNFDGYVTDNKKIEITQTNYISKENEEFVKNKKQIDDNIVKEEFLVVDARSKERFEGKVKEPRPGLKSGSIPKSKCIPFTEVVNENKTFKTKDELKYIFKSNLDISRDKDVVFSCGSGVTACVLAFAYYLISDNYLPKIYDGSWAEYGKF